MGVKAGDALAPLPTIGFYGAYAFTPRWLLSGRVDFFSMSYGDYDGSLTDVSAGVDYRFSRNFGVGVGYRYVDYDVDVTRTRLHRQRHLQVQRPGAVRNRVVLIPDSCRLRLVRAKKPFSFLIDYTET